jgi:uncharacterized alpha-E superfamily protein
MARYIERAENIARFIDVNHNMTLDLGTHLGDQWDPLIQTTGSHEAFQSRYSAFDRDSVLQFLTFDTMNPNSILSCVTFARENARTVREVISSVMWEELNQFYLVVREAAREGLGENPFEFYRRVKRASHLLIGVTDSTMSHGEAWNFAQLGRLLERADNTSRIVDVKYFILLPDLKDVGTSLDVVQWSALLKSADALEMYRRFRGRIVPTKVVDFLILDREFPRSLRYCLKFGEESLHAITGTPTGSFGNRAEQLVGLLRSELEFTSIQDVVTRGLHEFIDQFQIRLNTIGEAIQAGFFAIEPTQVQTQEMLP